MDITVTPTGDGRAWTLTDLLGRSMGRITEASAEQFTIHPDGYARETMASIEQGPFASLDAAHREAHPGRLPAPSGRGSTMIGRDPKLALPRG